MENHPGLEGHLSRAADPSRRWAVAVFIVGEDDQAKLVEALEAISTNIPEIEVRTSVWVPPGCLVRYLQPSTNCDPSIR